MSQGQQAPLKPRRFAGGSNQTTKIESAQQSGMAKRKIQTMSIGEYQMLCVTRCMGHERRRVFGRDKGHSLGRRPGKALRAGVNPSHLKLWHLGGDMHDGPAHMSRAPDPQGLRSRGQRLRYPACGADQRRGIRRAVTPSLCNCAMGRGIAMSPSMRRMKTSVASMGLVKCSVTKVTCPPQHCPSSGPRG